MNQAHDPEAAPQANASPAQYAAIFRFGLDLISGLGSAMRRASDGGRKITPAERDDILATAFADLKRIVDGITG